MQILNKSLSYVYVKQMEYTSGENVIQHSSQIQYIYYSISIDN